MTVKFALFNLCLLAALSGFASPESLPLRQSVTVEHSMLTLADLLPRNAPMALRASAASVEFGQAPQPGTLRVFTRVQLAQKLVGWPRLARALAIPSRITVTRPGYRISRARIQTVATTFLREHGWTNVQSTFALTLEWTGDPVASQEIPSLVVRGQGWDLRRQTLQLRMGCIPPADCGNFLLRTNIPQPASTNRRGIAIALASADRAPPALQMAVQRQTMLAPLLLRAGASATLVMQSGSMSISLPVICLQSGISHQVIRVRDATSPQVYRAEIVTAHLLHAAF